MLEIHVALVAVPPAGLATTVNQSPSVAITSGTPVARWRANARSSGVAAHRSPATGLSRAVPSGNASTSIRRARPSGPASRSATAYSGRSRTPCSATRWVARSGTAGPSRSACSRPRRSLQHPARPAGRPRLRLRGAREPQPQLRPQVVRGGADPVGEDALHDRDGQEDAARLHEAEPLDMARGNLRSSHQLAP